MDGSSVSRFLSLICGKTTLRKSPDTQLNCPRKHGLLRMPSGIKTQSVTTTTPVSWLFRKFGNVIDWNKPKHSSRGSHGFPFSFVQWRRVNINSYTKEENFNGFKLFEVAENYTAITEIEDCSVQLVINYDIPYYCAYLSPVSYDEKPKVARVPQFPGVFFYVLRTLTHHRCPRFVDSLFSVPWFLKVVWSPWKSTFLPVRIWIPASPIGAGPSRWVKIKHKIASGRMPFFFSERGTHNHTQTISYNSK